MIDEHLSQEQRILRTMRKVLAGVVKDTAPKPGMPHPLSGQTIEDIRACFALISVREAELNQDNHLKPVYADQPRSATIIPIGQATLKKHPAPPPYDGGDDAA
ncbi:MAG: segregation and condensation protein A [Sulfuricellaceae bacterium]